MERVQVIICTALLGAVAVCQANCPPPVQSDLKLVGCWDGQGRPLQPGQGGVPDNATCRLLCRSGLRGDNLEDVPPLQLKCWRGLWEGGELPCPGTSSDLTNDTGIKTREKRFFWIIAIAVGALLFLSGRLASRDRSPPHVICPVVPTTPSDPMQTTATVTWDEPTKAYDAEEKGNVRVHRTSAKGPGWTFGEGTTEVWYAAKDGSGNEGRCAVKIIVRVDRCYGPVGVEHGHHVCRPSTPTPGEQKGYVRGTYCTYGCYEGYELHGPSVLTCIANQEWSGPVPQCQRVECPVVPDPPHASHSCSDGLFFLSACSFFCSRGYDVAPGTSSVQVCGASGNWRGAQPRCQDSEAPRLEGCQAYQTLVADKGENSCLATWQEPWGTDNSGEHISPRLEPQLRQGARMEAGIHRLVYSAEDSAGNRARECRITLVIRELTCPQQHPKPYQRVLCPAGHRYGSNCSFSCETGFRLNGSDVSDCVMSDTSPPYALWEWNRGTKPHCQAGEVCPRLEPPTNGALACDTWEDGDFCKLLCQDGTDIPDNYAFSVVARLLVCVTNPAQGPHWTYTDPLPECTRVSPGHAVTMDARYSYYAGRCFEDEAQQEIKRRFVDFLANASYFPESCRGNPGCSAGNVEVTCGPVRTRRSSGDQEGGTSEGGPYQVHLSIELQMPLSASQSPQQNFLDSSWALSRAGEVLQQQLNQSLAGLLGPEAANGSLPVSGLQLEPSQPELVCPPGSLPSYTSFACVDCPKGSYFDAAAKSCLPCPVGQYQNQTGKSACLACPSFTTTLHPASSSPDSCLAQCPPGQASANGVVPCSPCARGYYQPRHGQTSCLPCPLSQATLHPGTQTQAECKEFDLTFPKGENASMFLEVLDRPALAPPLTLALWFQPDTEDPADMLRLLLNEHELLVALADPGTIAVAVDGSAPLKLANVTSGRWSHLVVELGGGEARASLDGARQSGSVVISGFSSQDFAKVTSLSLTLGGGGFAGSVSQLDVWSGQRSPPPPSLTPRCQQPPGGGGDVLGWRAWLLQARDRGAVLQLPSLCDDTNECTSNPCEHGTCTDDLRDFRCTCDAGFTGKACEVNLDDCVAHLCNNNATCVDGVRNYTCSCPPEYTGAFCDDIVTAGGWGSWGQWSECSVSCGNGSHTRARRCDSPPPQNGGPPCPGNATQTQTCNDAVCPECPELEAPEHGRLQCQEEEGLRRCQLACQEGFDFDVEPLPEYSCGLQSGYEWNFRTDKNPGRRFPNCMEVQAAEEVTTVYSATYRNLSCDDQKLATEASARIAEAMLRTTGNIECVRLQRCRIASHVVTDCEAGASRSKRALDSAGLSITLSSSPASVGMQTWIEDSVSAVQQLNSSGRSGAFTVQVQGQDYVLDIASGQFSGQVNCRQGWAKVNFYCVPCGPGTYWVMGYCLPCPVGRHQGASSQSACLPCPQGWSTPGEASLSVQECTVDVSSPTKVGLIVGAALGSLVAFIAVVVALVLYLKWSKRRNQVRVLALQLRKVKYEVADTAAPVRFRPRFEEPTLPQQCLTSSS